MERVYLLVEDMTQRRLPCLLNPETLVQRRLAGVQPRRSATGRLTGSGLTDDPLLYTGGGYTELALDLLFDVALADKPQKIENVRDLTQPLWELADTAPNGLHRGQPLMVRFLWGKEWNFLGVVVAVAERLDMFTSEGVPQRSWLRLKLVRSNPPAAEPTSARRSLSATELTALADRLAQAPEGLAEPVLLGPGGSSTPDQDQASGYPESEPAGAPESEAAGESLEPEASEASEEEAAGESPELDAAGVPEEEAAGGSPELEAAEASEGEAAGESLELEAAGVSKEEPAEAAVPQAAGAPEAEPAGAAVPPEAVGGSPELEGSGASKEELAAEVPAAEVPQEGPSAGLVKPEAMGMPEKELATPLAQATPEAATAGPAEPEAPAAPAVPPERRWRLAQRERLDQVAFRYYGDPAYWRLLAIFNGIDDPLHIPDGTVLRVPSIALVSEGP